MSFFGKLTKATLGVVTLPVAVVKDTLTLGGTITDNGEAYTGEKLRKVKKNLEKAVDELDGDESEW